MYQEKLKVMNMIAKRINDDNRQYILVDDQSELLRDLNTYFPKLIIYLWEQPETVANIIKRANSEELKEIAPLFANNFYDNILSPYYIEDNLMYILTLLLKDEINNLNNINQEENFLNETPCGWLLGELKSKNDIQAFFKTIILSSIENLEVNYTPVKMNFCVKELTDEYKKISGKDSKSKKRFKKDEGYQKYPDSEECSNSISLEDHKHLLRDKRKIKEDQENFNQKYIPFLDKKNFLKEIEKYKNNKNMYDYCYSKLNKCNSESNYYSNKRLMDSLYQSDFTQQLLLKYQHYFAMVISFVNSFLNKLLENYHLLPYSVKCLCKIISLLITKKFKQINEAEKNSFIAKFFFGKLLLPILENPAIEALINEFIISKNTYDNLKIISKIIGKFVSGGFFEANDDNSYYYTPYNWYFIEKMEDLFKIFNNITKVKLPFFIEKLINDELPSDFQYNYFIENPDEIINHRSICYNTSQIKAIVSIMNRCKDDIFKDAKTAGLKKTMEKIFLQNNQSIINNILKEEEIIKKPKKESPPRKSKKGTKEDIILEPIKTSVHYFLLTSLLTNQKYDYLMHINQETSSFSIKELTADNEENIQKNNIIKVKNFLCSLLYNYNKLVKTDFDEGTTENTESILKELNIFMKSSNFVVDDSIPFDWYLKSLLEYLQKIPEHLTKNDCEELYNEIENDLNRSLKELNFEALSVIIGKLKYAQRGRIHYEQSRNLLNDIILNEDTKAIVEHEFIPFEIKFNFEEDNDQNNVFEIIQSINFKEKDKDNPSKIKEYEKSKKIRLCLTINDFTKKFPNLVKYQEMQDADIFEIQSDLDFPTKINSYFNQIKQILDKKKVESSINEKIFDYVMCKLYDKIYPIEPYSQDNVIFQQSIRLSWTQPKHFIRSKRSLVFGSFLSDALSYFELIDKEKSPRKKLLNVLKIFNSIGFLLKFNGSGQVGVDDQLPILNYAFIKSQPLRFFSNAKYMELYIGDKKNKNEGSQLTQLLGICDIICNLKYTQLIGVTQEEFFEKCKEATNDINPII